MQLRKPGPKVPVSRNEKLIALADQFPQLTYEQLGKVFGITRQRVHQILKAQLP